MTGNIPKIEGKDNHECPICAFSTTHFLIYERHMETHEEPNPQGQSKAECYRCDTDYSATYGDGKKGEQIRWNDGGVVMLNNFDNTLEQLVKDKS